jgi:hypothetical protein
VTATNPGSLHTPPPSGVGVSAPGAETPRCSTESGTGIVATLTGVAVFSVLLLLAVQVLVDLYARSTLGAVVYDAVRVVSGSDAGATPSSLAAAEATARAELGRAGEDAAFRWRVGASTVELTVTLTEPSLLPASLVRPLALDHVTTSVVLRRELPPEQPAWPASPSGGPRP